MFPSLPKSRNRNLFPNIPKRSKKQSLFPSFNRMKKMGETFKFLDGWNKNNIYEITIDHTKIGSSLTYFPVTVVLNTINASDLFSHLGATNWKKIAITDENAKELYIEKEQYNSTTTKATLHVSRSDFVLSRLRDTKLYLYYDSTHSDNDNYVGEANSTPAKKVWDYSFKLVYNMAQDPSGGSNCIKDSTINNNHGTPNGGMTSTDLVSTNIGKAINFDGSDDLINVSANASINTYTKMTAFVLAKITVNNGTFALSASRSSCSQNLMNWQIYGNVNGYIYGNLKDPSNNSYIVQSSEIFPLNTWVLVTLSYDGEKVKLYKNEKLIKELGAVFTPKNAMCSINIADESCGNNTTGLISYMSFTNSSKSNDWVKAMYFSLTNDLLTIKKK